MIVVGRTLMLLGHALGAIAEGLDFVAETCADAAEFAAGGRIMLGIYNEPIPPISMQTIDEEHYRPVAEHPWKAIAELDDSERAGGGSS